MKVVVFTGVLARILSGLQGDAFPLTTSSLVRASGLTSRLQATPLCIDLLLLALNNTNIQHPTRKSMRHLCPFDC